MPEASSDRSRVTFTSWYTLFVLTIVYAINIADRFVISTFVEPIKKDLALSDSQIGDLAGISIFFYVIAGIPLGYLADRFNRRSLVAWSLGAWSLLMATCGLTRTYPQLLAARVGVGIGEAGGTAPSQSLIADCFPVRWRTLAASIFALGAAIGLAIGTTVSGRLEAHFGWRQALLILGLAGLPIALLMRFTVREPARGQLDAAPPRAARASLRETLRFIGSQRSAVHILIGATVSTLWGWGILFWLPAFLGRSYQLTVDAAGDLLGPMNLYGGGAVTLLTAWLVYLNSKRDVRRDAWLVGIVILIAVVPGIWMFLTDSLDLTRWLLWIFIPLNFLYLGPTFGMLQNLVPASMRGLLVAILLFAANIANLWMAPKLYGMASDYLVAQGLTSADALRRVLLWAGIFGIWGAWHYFAAARSLKEDFARAGSVG